jgi:hypothetical protein
MTSEPWSQIYEVTARFLVVVFTSEVSASDSDDDEVNAVTTADDCWETDVDGGFRLFTGCPQKTERLLVTFLFAGGVIGYPCVCSVQ